MTKLTFIPITSGSMLHSLYTEDLDAVKENLDYEPDNPKYEYQEERYVPVTDHDPTTQTLVERKACTKMLILNINGKPIMTNEWFITYGENELIYNIEDNRWVNLNMYDDKTSYCSEIYYVKRATNDNL